LPQNGGVLSFRRHKGGGGIDYELAKAVATSLGVKLTVVWYESEDDEESNPIDEVNAFMSYGLCQMAASFPLHAGAIAQVPGRSVRLPRYRHMPEGDVGKFVDLSKLIVSRPYRSTRFVVVLPGASTLTVKRLADLEGKRLLAEEGTVAGAIAMQYRGGLLRDKVDLVPPGPKTLWILEAGKHDAAIIELDKFDAHLKQNRVSKLKLSGYEHSIRYNIALVSIAKHKALIDQANKVIAAGLKDGSIAAMARRSGMSYRPPDAKRVRGPLSFTELARD
jgi:ABC-type amino acid transport substrate-binding protein